MLPTIRHHARSGKLPGRQPAVHSATEGNVRKHRLAPFLVVLAGLVAAGCKRTPSYVGDYRYTYGKASLARLERDHREYLQSPGHTEAGWQAVMFSSDTPRRARATINRDGTFAFFNPAGVKVSEGTYTVNGDTFTFTFKPDLKVTLHERFKIDSVRGTLTEQFWNNPDENGVLQKR
jgi:hypothetical protein